ncbi:NAD(P)-dependent alcohol dehydrogenase [Sphingomonas crocodyli]|nr:NAD(P)-dependent alcohol dehydrogenase [Sphingomonas crocodyli]
MNIEAYLFHGPGQPLSLETIEICDPAPGELLVKLVGTGICHTDVSMTAGRRDWGAPTVLGHEGAGHVVAIGEGVEDFAVGDAVVLSFRSCGECPVCDSGHPGYCDEISDLNFSGKRRDGTTPLSRDGKPVMGQFFGQSSFATHSIVHASAAVKVDPSLPLELLGPLACGIQTGAGAVINVLKPDAGKAFALFGAGSVGLSGLMAAKMLGCDPIIAVDVMPERREAALRFGATHAIDPLAEDPVAAIKAITGGRGAAYSFDATSKSAVLAQAFLCLDSFGRCAYVGAHETPDVALNSHRFMRGCTLHGVMEGDSRPRDFIPELIGYWQAGRLPFDQMVSFYPFSELDRAVADMNSGRAVKPILRFDAA